MVIINNVVTNLRSLTSNFTPTKIEIAEDSNWQLDEIPCGKQRAWKRPTSCDIRLNFNYLSEANLQALRNVIHNNKYEKKVYVDEPSTLQVYDTYDHASNNNKVYHGTSTTATLPSTWTELTDPNYLTIQDINTTYYEKSTSTGIYQWMKYVFDISDFYDQAIDARRYTLFMHNPYAAYNDGVDTFNDGFKVFIDENDYTDPYYDEFIDLAGLVCIGEQSYSLTDIALRANSHMNQQGFSVKRTQDLSQMNQTNQVIFYVRNMKPRATGHTVYLGLNYVGLMINGYVVKPIMEDNFTYETHYTGSGLAGQLTLAEST